MITLLFIAACATDACVESAEAFWALTSESDCAIVAAALNRNSDPAEAHAFCLPVTTN